MQLLEEFLVSAGLPVADLTGPPAPSRDVAGAAVLLGALAGPAEARAAQGVAASPCPDVPDLAVVVFTAGSGTARDARDVPALARGDGTAPGPWVASWSAAEHAAAVESVRRSIEAGDVYQVNVVGHWSRPFEDTADWVAQRLGALRDTPYAGAVGGAGWSVVSASPELFLDVREGYARTRPIKGTVPREPDRTADGEAAGRLRASAKDQAEHIMIVDLERNDLGRVARSGGVKVSRLYGVDPLAGMWHGVSEVAAHLQPGVGLAALLDATFPGGSVTGAPKLAALREIGRLEPVGRGPAMGALGWVAADGSTTLGLTIRTFALAAGMAHVWAGGGVTWGSDPDAEVAEAGAKLAPLIRLLDA
jgi:para-aminobenzoate synthetase component 1